MHDRLELTLVCTESEDAPAVDNECTSDGGCKRFVKVARYDQSDVGRYAVLNKVPHLRIFTYAGEYLVFQLEALVRNQNGF